MCTPQCICEKLGGLGFEEAIRAGKYVRHYSKNLQKLKDKLKDLDDCMEIITREVSVADVRGDEIEVNVSHWRTDADKFKADNEKLIGESTTKASISCIACSCPNIVWQYKFSKQAEEKIAEAVELIGKYNNFNHQISHHRSHYAENLRKLKDKLRDLDDCRETITRKVSEANGRGDEIEVNVLRWQKDADSLLDHTEQPIRESTNICSTDITRQYEFSKQAEEKIADADELINKYNNFNHQISHPRPRPPELESLSDKNYVNFESRGSIFMNIMDELKDSNVNMIGVFGPGGVGKTTLVKEVGEQMRKDGTFKQVAMAAVSKDLNVNEVQSRLAASLNFKFKAEVDDQVGRATELWNKLTNGDKYLIILDDIWQEVKMEAIGIPCTNEKKGCKVVLTSRKEDLLKITMKADKNFRIGELSDAEAMDLFKKKVGKTIESQPDIDSLAQEVCRKCKGLPVAINAIGAALEDKPYCTWKNALVKLERHMFTQIEGIDPSVWASLYVSYDMLRSSDAQSHSRSSDAQSRSDAQSCFLLCCLFHEDVEIPIYELMRLCIARSLLAQNPFTLDEARNAVHTVVDALKSASLLTTGSHENVVRIHDVIRDVGISIARDQGEAFLIDHGAPRWPPIPMNAPSYSAISLAFKDIKRLPSGLVYPQLHTLIVENSKLSDVEFPDNFFNGMTQLSVLVITRMRMCRLPSSLAKLAKLRMLYLDQCKLADIAILKHLKSNLEVLGIRRSNITALPPEIGQLTSLRVLDLQDCYELRVIPRGVISNLTGLEELYFPFNFAEWKATIDEQQDASNRDNVSLEDLRQLLNSGQLTTLQIHIPNVKLLPNDDLIFANLKGFKISVGSKFDYWEGKLSTTRTCMLKAEGIRLRNEFISLVDKAEVLVLKGIQLTVYPFRLSNKLTVVTIEEFELKYLFTPTTVKELVHLEKLEVRSCEIMEGIVGLEGQNDGNEIICEVKFSKLKKLKLTNLRNLKSFYAKKEKMGTTMESSSARAQPLFNEKVIFPVLESLTIEGLDNIIMIWDKQSIAHVLEEQGSFCQLTDLEVKRCNKLMHVFPSNMHPPLKNLKKLEVKDCETMKGIAEFEREIDEDGHRNEVAASPALEVEHLEMVGVPKITEIRDKQPLLEPKKEVESLCKLMDIRIEKCGQLLYVFPSHMLPQNLQQLQIQECDELEVIFSKELKEKEAINNDIIVFPRLKAVTLKTLRKLKSFYTDTQGFFFSHKVIFPVLDSLTIDGLGNIIKIWDKQSIAHVLEEQGSFCQLKSVNVQKCAKLIHVFPSNMHPQLKNLERLEVKECETMNGIVEFEGEIDEDGLRNEVASPAREHLEMVGVTEIQDKQPLPEPRKEVESSCRPVNNDDIIVFPQLKDVSLCGLPELKSFYSETQGFFSHKVIFPVLKKLSIRKVHKIIEIWDKQSIAILEEQWSFCQLTDLDVSECEKLMHLFPSKMHSPLKNLKVLRVSDCPTMEGIVDFGGEIDEDGLKNEVCFSELSSLVLSSLPNLECFCTKLGKVGTTEGNSTIHALPLFNGKVVFPVLKHTWFWKLDKITRIWDDQPLSEPEKEDKSFSELEDIIVRFCDQLEYVLPSYMLPQLKNLQELSIEYCTKVEVIISNNPKEKEATNNNDTIRFPQLKTLTLSSLPNLKSFICSDETQSIFSNKVVFPVLKRMQFHILDKITRIWNDQPLLEPEKEDKSFSELEDIDVLGCNQLEYVLPSYKLPQLKNLQELSIQNCTKVEVIISNNPKEKEATNNNDTIRFPQLKTLALSSLPNLKSFICSDETQSIFSNKVAFPVLKRLLLAKLDNITRIWDNQPLLELKKKAKSFCKLMVIIVVGCEDLEYALPFYMLPQLKNLEELRIERCRKMEVIISNNLKEKEDTNNNDTIRFPQLKTLNLGWLPNLKSFICSEKQLFFSNKVQIKDAFPVLESISIKDLKSPTKKGHEEDLRVQHLMVRGLRFKRFNFLERYMKKVSVKDPFPVLIQLILDEDSEILRDGTYTKEVSMEECSTSGKKSDPNGEELDEDLETPTKEISMEECSTSGKESDHNGKELDEDLETPTKEECGTSGKQNDHNGEQG